MFIRILLILLFATVGISFSQKNVNRFQSDKFFFDAITFRSDSIGKSRIDCYSLIPYENLFFVDVGESFGATYSIVINVRDTSNNLLETRKIDKNVKEKEYFITQGGSGGFDYNQNQFFLSEGTYEIEAIFTDILSKQESSRTRRINSINYDKFNYALSGILLLSSVEEVNGKYKITPHISDNIGNMEQGYFIFFESYNKSKQYDSIDFVWEILDSKNQLVAYSNRTRKDNSEDVVRIFLKIPPIKEMSTGSFTLRVLALEPLNIKDYSDKTSLAIANRSIKYIKTVGANIMTDLNLAIRQLRYIAGSDDLSAIKDSETDAEKQKKFQEFWKRLDPSPSTERNEAFDEYYLRINYANQKFKSYQEGWMTDMGMVYVIFGNPINVDRPLANGDNKVYELWIYGNNREFLFVDNTGFGDFRLLRPFTITEKFKYTR